MVSANDIVSASVDASVVGRIKAGDLVQISTEGATGPVTGTVHSIGLIADTSSGVATFPVTVQITGSHPSLRDGMSATVVVIVNQVVGVLSVPTVRCTPTAPRRS